MWSVLSKVGNWIDKNLNPFYGSNGGFISRLGATMFDPLGLYSDGTYLNFGGLSGSDYLKAYTGVSNVESQKEANAYNLQAARETNATSMQIARENNQLQQQMFQDQMRENRRYFEDTMAYNSAASQAARLRAAGLNPALALYQGVNAGSVSASSAPAAPAMQQPTLQVPHMQPVDYSPIASGVLNSLSLITQLAPALESLGRISGASAAGKAKQLGEVGAAKSQAVQGRISEATEKAAVRVAEATAKSAEQATYLNDQELIKGKFDAMMSELKSNWLGEKEVQTMLKEAFSAEWLQKIEQLSLTRKQINSAAIQQMRDWLEYNKENLSKKGYETLSRAINDDSFTGKVGRFIFTALDYFKGFR